EKEHTIKWKKLPVSLINVIVINKILGLPLDGKTLHDKVEYVNDFRMALEKYRDKKDEYYGIFFVSPMTISVVNDIVSCGERMPQKSTNFYPKVYSGLVLHKMDLE
ncbi:MAG: hypothetical protein N2053_04520, partial [Chitinispirillaceae bacterium]|nr:hypothetical protein [Chitinispirillaceae bacterium]